MNSKFLQFLASILLILAAGSSFASQAQSVSDELDKALSFLEQIDPAKVTEADEEKVSKQIEAAWTTIRKAGPAGKARLKEELVRSGQSDYFKLNGTALLWTIAGLDEAETIASIWRTTQLNVQSNYVFYPAFEAALKQDARALPMLFAVLGNKDFHIYVVLHALEVKWPLTIQFIWGAYGPKALPILLKVLNKSKVPAELQSAIVICANDQYIEALPRIRELAQTGDDYTRRIATYALGIFGHPQDFDSLISGLKSANKEDRFYAAMAVYEYEDLRAVPQLIPLLNDPDKTVRREVFANLTHLLTSESLDALQKYSQRVRGDEKVEVDDYLSSELQQYGLTISDYSKKSAQDRALSVESIRQRRESSRFLLRSDEKALTHEQFLRAAEEWKMSHHMRMSSNEMSVETRQILSAATPSDITLLLEVKASVYGRLSDECLYEVARIDAAVKRLGRSRYRKDVGITERVVAP